MPALRVMSAAALMLPVIGGALLVVTWSSDQSALTSVAAILGGGIGLVILAMGMRTAWQHYQTLRNEVRAMSIKLGRASAAETALRNQLAFADLVFETASAMLIVQDASGKVVKSNARGRDTAGVERLLAGQDDAKDWEIRTIDGQMIPPEQWARTINAATGATETPYELRRPNQEPTWVSVSASTFQAPTGAKAGTVLSVRDVTDSHQSQRTETAPDGRFERTISVINDAVWEIEPASGRAFFTPQFAGMLGYEPHELAATAETWSSLIHPDDAAAVEAARETTFKTGERFSAEYRLCCRDGSFRWVHTTGCAVRDANGNVAMFHGATRDITEARERMAAVERARGEAVTLAREAAAVRERHRLAIDGGELIEWEWDVASGAMTSGDRWLTLTGYAAGEIPATVEAWSALLHADDLSRYRMIVEAHDAGERESIECDCRVRAKDGNWLWLRIRGRVTARDAFGTAATVAGTYADITPLKNAEDALRGAEEAAETARRARSQFLANMSHEIRSPLTAILGFAELLLDPSLEPGLRRDHVETIRRNGHELLRTLNEIMDFSRLDVDGLAVAPLRIEPQQLVNEVIELMLDRAEGKGLALQAIVSPEASRPIVTDPARLRQVLVNLIAHAIESTPTGSVTVECSVTPTGHLLMEVADTGIGMTDLQREAIFKPFSQDARLSRAVTAAGLGLAIAFRLAKLLGGDLSATGSPGEGSRFMLTLPMSCPSLAGIEARDLGRDAESVRGMHVLVAEDGVDQQRLIRFFLQRLGVTYELVGDGQAAVDALLAKPEAYAAVLMDMQMPILDGYGATEQLRGRGISVPIIALTAATSVEERDRCASVGCSDFLAKPIHSADLAVVLARLASDAQRVAA
jgi:PAS domain S-box-containing protein